MPLEDMLRGLTRAPWRAAAIHILERSKLEQSVGYEATVSAIKATPPDKAKEAVLRVNLIEHLVAGEKHVRFVQLHPGERAKVDAWIRGSVPDNNLMTNAFPGIATEAQITPFRHQAPSAVGFHQMIDGVATIYTAARSYVTSEDLPANYLKDGFAAGYEKLTGFKSIYVQTYDAIWLPSTGDIAVIVSDYPSPGPKQSFPVASSDFLLSELRNVLKRKLSVANFWHAIDGLYVSPDGKLVDYGFSAGGQSVNHHRARRKTSICLRKAVYDAAGAAALKQAGKSLELFKVAMKWSVTHQDKVITDPEALLPGVAADLNKPMAIVDHCVIRDCLTTGDLAFVVTKLLPHIKVWV